MTDVLYADSPEQRPWITYLPCNPEGVPLLSSLCDDSEMVRALSPFEVWNSVHPDVNVGTLMVCHSGPLAEEAIGLAEERPIVIWAWLLDENEIAKAAQHVPVVFGAVLWNEDVLRVEPSQPMQYVADEARLCAQLENAFGIPSSKSLMTPR